MVLGGEGEELLEHERVGAEEPARLEADAGVGIADARDAFGVAAIEAAREGQLPVPLLCLLDAGDVPAAEEVREGGDAAQVIVEGIEDGIEARGEGGPKGFKLACVLLG